jgi:hypothetical protein
MNIIETKKIEQIDSIGRWSQERIMNMCAHIIMASNEIQKYEKVCGDELDVGEDLLTVLQTTPLMYEGVLNGVIKVHLNSDLEPNSAVIHHGDTGIKLIFLGLVLTSEGIAFAKEDYYLNMKAEESNKKDELFKQTLKMSEESNVENLISDFIVNRLGINLCSVKSINVDRQEDGQIREIKIEFIPSTGED